MSREQIAINGEVVRWAIGRANVTPERIAKKFKVGPEVVRSWWRDSPSLSLARAMKLAEVLYIPFGYLLLSEPPADELPLKDFRTLHGGVGQPSANLLDLLNDVIFKQRWLAEERREGGASKLDFVGRFARRSHAAEVIAADIAETLGLNEEFRKLSPSWSTFLGAFIERVESIGVAVLKTRTAFGNPHRPIAVSEFRGFAICDPFAPVVCMNSGDADAAQIFTLAHELAHIWTGLSGISNDAIDTLHESSRDTESFCNAIAAEVLVPGPALIEMWNPALSIIENANEVRVRFRVSSLVALRRAVDTGRITRDQFKVLFKQELARVKAVTKKSTYANPIRLAVARNSRLLTSAMVAAVGEGRLGYLDAARMLSVKTDTIPKIEKLLKSKGGA